MMFVVCSTGIDVLVVTKRSGKFTHWEPVFIGTHQDPYYDERLSWDGMKDKMLQGRILCVQDYDFMVLNHAFLVHKPGIKRSGKQTKARRVIIARQTRNLKYHITDEVKIIFGTRAGCHM